MNFTTTTGASFDVGTKKTVTTTKQVTLVFTSKMIGMFGNAGNFITNIGFYE